MPREPANQNLAAVAPVPDHAVFDLLMKAARAGDWRSVEELTVRICACAVTQDGFAMQEYIQLLKDALVVAKAARADLAMSAVRINAAARFGADDPAPADARQNPGIVPGF